MDGLRGLAILLVLVYHGTLNVWVNVGEGALDRFVAFLAHGGWSGVDLFFVLSGFLITGILYDSKGTRTYFKTFYARRVLRIFPLYYAVLALLLIVAPMLSFVRQKFEPLAGDEIWYWLYLSNFSLAFEHAAAPRRLDVFWSLAIEEQFYLFWPLVVQFLHRRALMLVCVGMIGVALASRIGLMTMGVHPQAIFVLTTSRLDALAVGGFIALASRGPGGISQLFRWARPIMMTCVLGLVTVAASSGSLTAFSWGMQSVGYTLLAVVCGSALVLILGTSTRSSVVRVFENRILQSFGRYSYALYLFHIPLFILILLVIYHPAQFPPVLGSTIPGALLFYIISISVTFGCAWISWNLLEKHFLALKRFFPYERKADASRQTTDLITAPESAKFASTQ